MAAADVSRPGWNYISGSLDFSRVKFQPGLGGCDGSVTSAVTGFDFFSELSLLSMAYDGSPAELRTAGTGAVRSGCLLVAHQDARFRFVGVGCGDFQPTVGFPFKPIST